MLPLQGRYVLYPRPRAALALALGYGIKPLRGLSAIPCEPHSPNSYISEAKFPEVDDVLDHLSQTHPHYLRDKKLLAKMADYLADKRGSLDATKTFSPDVEARTARILADVICNQKI